jgi:hypothetical protein
VTVTTACVPTPPPCESSLVPTPSSGFVTQTAVPSAV